jgi:hypothetical protein
VKRHLPISSLPTVVLSTTNSVSAYHSVSLHVHIPKDLLEHQKTLERSGILPLRLLKVVQRCGRLCQGRTGGGPNFFKSSLPRSRPTRPPHPSSLASRSSTLTASSKARLYYALLNISYSSRYLTSSLITMSSSTEDDILNRKLLASTYRDYRKDTEYIAGWLAWTSK